jgi:RNA polymerase sigma-70 factor (ECF subfamily)
MIKEADRERLVSAIARLLPQQRDLLDKVYIKDIPIKEIASLEGVSSSAISHRLKKIHKRLEKLLKTFD